MTDYLMNIPNKKDERYADYEELLIRRDQLYKDADSIMIAYTKEFGDLIAENFEIKIECIKKKKMIHYCQKLINKGACIDRSKMDEAINEEMLIYQQELDEILKNNKDAKEATTVSEFKIIKAKRIYHRLARKLHPDINKKTAENKNLSELWNRIVRAYNMSDIDTLEELETLARKALERLGEEGFEIAFTDIEERIAKVEHQINDIITSEPYIYRYILEDTEQKEAKKKELEDTKAEYTQYLNELTEKLDDLLTNGGVMIRWQMN